MPNIYVLLDADTSGSDLRAFTDAVEDNGGRIAVFLPPQLAIVDGGGATHEALGALVGGVVRAVGFEDVTPLALAALDSVELTRLITLLALTTTAATEAADLVRPFDGEVWSGVGCIPGEV
jgi:hypothetical protein